MYDIENYTHHGLTIRIVPDDHDDSPRGWDNLGVMVCGHRNYNLGDVQIKGDEYDSVDHLLTTLVEDYEPTVVLPLYLFDHSGITIRSGPPVDLTELFIPDRQPFTFDPGGWDTSFVGFILDTPETRDMVGTPPDLTQEALEGEVETYATYLEGGVVGYMVEDENGNHLDSCFGFYDLDDAKAEAEDVAEHAAVELAEQRAADLVIVRAAQNLYAIPSIRIHTRALIVESDDGYWVAAEVLVPKETT